MPLPSRPSRYVTSLLLGAVASICTEKLVSEIMPGNCLIKCLRETLPLGMPTCWEAEFCAFLNACCSDTLALELVARCGFGKDVVMCQCSTGFEVGWFGIIRELASLR
ncbi:hypothetical protein RchiOBHm_Chr1g0381101 [Rosa chinensis]|uniref:Uncharacterized protein n=1 Tax=Rosa chinensis TaxID=74649 RepID=A0A2P6SP31_ROSCH|nr:hypothetical protein RchiOBHm_Chr1g0381101 [Rosa chinensis]